MEQSKSSVGALVAHAANPLTRERLHSGSHADPIQLSDSSDDDVS